MNIDKDFIIALPKGELHVHLNGLVSPEVVKKIVREEGIELPTGFDINLDLIRTEPSPSLQDYLKPWELLRLIPSNRENLKVLVEDAFYKLKAENVNFAEIRNSILYIAMLNDISVEKAMGWLIEDLENYSEKFGIKSGLVLTTPRGDYSSDHFRALIKAYKQLGRPNRVVGLDLAGNEDIPVPSDLGKQFMRVKQEYGLKITIHAGETGKKENVISAIEEFGADRIGHGTAAKESVEIMHLLKEKNICLEVCPVSNRLTNCVKKEECHPVNEFIENEVPFVICSDNPGIHGSSISDDYIAFYKETEDMTVLKTMYETQKKYTFLRDIK